MALRGAALQRAAHFVPRSFALGTALWLKVQLHRAAASSLIPGRMKYWLRMFSSWWRRFFRPPQPTADRSRLVGMYLSQANQPPDSGARGSEIRERQEGKFSQNRRRG